MRPLTEDETRLVLTKLTKYLGGNVMLMVEVKDDSHVFRLHKERVMYMSEVVLNAAGCIPRKQLVCAGTVIGKFTKSNNFRLALTALPYLVRFAKNKMWLKPSGEQSFLYGNHVIKKNLGKVTENTEKNLGVCVMSANDIPLGFGVTSRSTVEMRSADVEAIVAFHQADIGEFLRDEQGVF